MTHYHRGLEDVERVLEVKNQKKGGHNMDNEKNKKQEPAPKKQTPQRDSSFDDSEIVLDENDTILDDDNQ